MQFNATYPTLPVFYSPPPLFVYPPPRDANQNESSQNGIPAHAPYMISFPPPAMFYAFPPPQDQVPPGRPLSAPPPLTKPKRKQVKMACTNCAAACKRCDEGRPCERCQKYGIGDSCRDGQRKERKKGIKRGPYKRESKTVTGDVDWVPAQAATAVENAPMPTIPEAKTILAEGGQLLAQFSSPEGYYGVGPIYYPTLDTFLLHNPHPGHEIPSGQEGHYGSIYYPTPGASLPYDLHEISSWKEGSNGQSLVMPTTFVPHHHPGHEIPSGQEGSSGQPPISNFLPAYSPHYPHYENPLHPEMSSGAQSSPA